MYSYYPPVTLFQLYGAGAVCQAIFALRIDDDLGIRSAEQDFQSVQNVAAENALIGCKIGLQSAGVFLTVKPDRNAIDECRRRAASNAAHEALHALVGRQIEQLTIFPRQNAAISAGIRNDSIQDNALQAAVSSKFRADIRQGFARIAGIVFEPRAANTTGSSSRPTQMKNGCSPVASESRSTIAGLLPDATTLPSAKPIH